MQSARHLVGIVVEFAAGMKFRHDDFSGGALQFVILFDPRGNAPPIILYRYGIIRMNNDGNFIAITRQRFVNRIVHYLEYHVMQSGAVTGIANVHAGPFAYRVETFQDLDAVGTVIRGTFTFLLLGTVFVYHY